MQTNSLCLPIPNQRLSLIRVVLGIDAEEFSRSLCHSLALVHQVSKPLDLSDFVCAQVNSYTHDGTLRKLL